ncbi:proton-conducting transporter membrane subunit [Mycoplasmatota bacterium zrk1]
MNPVLLIAIPLLFAFLSIMNKKFARPLLLVALLLDVYLVFTISKGLYSIGGFSQYGINLLVDQYSLIGLMVVNVVFFLTVVTNCKEVKRLSTVLLVALAGVNGLLLTNDLFNLFVFLEIVGISAYLITSGNKRPLATFNYLVQGTVGSGLYLLGLILLYSMTGTLNMALILPTIVDKAIPLSNLALPFMLMFIGLGVEAKLLPFNSWVKGVLQNANALTSVLIADVFATTIALTFGRLLSTVFVLGSISNIVLVILAVTMLAGEVAAFASKRIREVLLFSAIAQSGLIILLFANGLVIPAIMLIIANIVSKYILFTITGKMVDKTNTDEIESLQGVFSKNKLIGFAFTVASLSVIGLPLFFGFIVKLNVLTSLFSQYQLFLPALILVVSLIEGTYFVKLLIKLWYPVGEVKTFKVDALVKVVTLIFALGLIVFGVYTKPLTDSLMTVPEEMMEAIAEGGDF